MLVWRLEKIHAMADGRSTSTSICQSLACSIRTLLRTTGSTSRMPWNELKNTTKNTITQAVVYVMSDIVLVILAVVTLGYLGLGIQPPAPDWGSMISDGQSFIQTNQWLAAIPGLAVVLTGIGLSLLGDGLADVMRPE